MLTRASYGLLVSFLLLAGVGARAQPPVAAMSDEARAEKHFEAGRALFELGNYRDAIREWTAGYELTKRAAFLLNIGHAHRELRDLDKASAMYHKYLELTPRSHPSYAVVLKAVDEIDRERAARPPEPATTAPEHARPATATPPPPAAVVPVAATTSTAPAPHAAAHKRRTAWIVGGVVLGVAVVTGAVVAGVVGAQATRDWCGGDRAIGCFTAE